MLAALALCTAITAGRADAIDDTLARFSADKFDETQRGVQELALSGHATGEEILAALLANRLFFRPVDRAVFYRDAAGALRDARSGGPAQGETVALKPVRLNNRVRRAIEAALGAFGLTGPDPARQIRAAEAVLKARDAAVLPAIETALSREGDPAVRRALEGARAAIVLSKADASEGDRLAAVSKLAARGDGDAAALLRSVPTDAPEAVRAAAAAGVASIEQRLALWGMAQNLAYGISLGSILLLAAVGLAITFGQMGVINMAHGEMVMLGAYTTFVVQELIRAHAPGLFGASLFIAIPLAFLVAGAVGVAIERGIIRFLYGRPLETLLATWGLSLILQQAIRSLFGPSNREVGTPAWMSGAFQVGGLNLTYGRVAIVVFALGVFAALLLVLRRTALGLQVRAVTQNRRMASAMGSAPTGSTRSLSGSVPAWPEWPGWRSRRSTM